MVKTVKFREGVTKKEESERAFLKGYSTEFWKRKAERPLVCRLFQATWTVMGTC